MNHRHHSLVMISVGAVVMMMLLVTGANATAIGVGLAFLVCPIVMGTVMWLLMRPAAPRPEQRPRQLSSSTRREL